MKKDIVTVIYDRKKTSARRGTGKVEVRIYLSRTERKYITLAEATPEEWKKNEREDKFADIRKRYEDILYAMEILGKEMSIDCFNACAGIEEAVPQEKKEKKSFNPYIYPYQGRNAPYATFHSISQLESYSIRLFETWHNLICQLQLFFIPLKPYSKKLKN